MSGVITLTTDFGINDGYIASLKGVILDINPSATVIDICNTIKPQNILQASYIINGVFSYFPEKSIHLVIIDPDVGSKRKAIILSVLSHYFIAPDNGVMSFILNRFIKSSKYNKSTGEFAITRKKIPDNTEATAITNSLYWNKKISPVFHGRDIFAPVAAYLSSGLPASSFGASVHYLNTYNNLQPYKNSSGEIIGKIIHIDNFGNIITNIEARHLSRTHISVLVGGIVIHGINKYYAEKDDFIALLGSSDYLEVSLRNGNASAKLGVTIGDMAVVRSG